MSKLNSLAKLVQLSRENLVAESFLNDLVYTIENENKNTRIPTKSYKPSSISGCMRSMYYQILGVKPDEQTSDYNLTGICESGTNRHEDIQGYVMKMWQNNIDCEWLDVEEHLHYYPVTGTTVINKHGNETKCFNSKYNLRFLCDGLIEYNGERYILEIKTESTHKYAKHSEPHQDHILQATCYSLCLGIDQVIFIYEDRDNCSKKGFLVKITDKMKHKIINKIEECDYYVNRLEIPPRELDKCLYCNYKEKCREDGV